MRITWLLCTIVALAASPVSAMKAELQTVQLETEQMLKDHSFGIQDLQTGVGSVLLDLDGQRTSLLAKEQDLIRRTVSLQEMVQQVNDLQLTSLAKQLNETIHTELQSRVVADDDAQAQQQQQLLSIDDMKESLKADDILEDTEEVLQNWIVTVVEQEVSDVRIAAATATAEKIKKKPSTTPSTSTTTCLTPSDGAQLVQESIVEHRATPKNHLEYATVVHEFTTDTYQAPPSSSDLMGNIWWRRYIPADWERLFLPDGWQEWNVGLAPAFYRLMGIQGASTLPPEAILDPNVYPGACWPLQGQKGHVTLRLAQPVQFESITIDHAPLLLTGGSTPRHFEITGYPHSNTSALGFDTTKGKLLSIFEFDATKSSQTFEVTPDLSGSCDEEIKKPSCDDAPLPLPVIAGIKIEIVGNWGNQDYTCLYHARLQGSIVV